MKLEPTRFYMELVELTEFDDGNNCFLIIGPRQSGKTEFSKVIRKKANNVKIFETQSIDCIDISVRKMVDYVCVMARNGESELNRFCAAYPQFTLDKIKIGCEMGNHKVTVFNVKNGRVSYFGY